jgi:hypothetical protein
MAIDPLTGLYEYVGNYSATDPAYSRGMQCDKCEVSWTGCWDNFQCPRCGEGELPTNDIKVTQYNSLTHRISTGQE